MSGLMKLLGLVLIIAAAVFVLLLKLSSAQMQVWGISPDVIATLLVGGVIGLGLAGVIDAVTRIGSGFPMQAPAAELIATAVAIAEPVVEEKAVSPSPIGFGRKRAETPPAFEPEVSALPVAKSVAATSVADTIAALEQAKSDIKTALGGVESMSGSVESPRMEPVATEGEVEPDSEELYVVEEKIIRGRPSRILSDDTVEAETDEGWMRFENLEHLNEYLDSVEEANA